MSLCQLGKRLISIYRVVPSLAVTMSFLCCLSLIYKHLRHYSRTGFLFPGVSNSSPKQCLLPSSHLCGKSSSLSKSDVSAPSAVTHRLQAAAQPCAAPALPQLIAICLAFVSQWKGYCNTCWERLATGNSSDGDVSIPLSPIRPSDF